MKLLTGLVVLGLVLAQGCSRHAQPPLLVGTVSYEDGAPGAGAVVAIADAATGTEAAVVVADGNGHFGADVPVGAYALAVATPRGFAWLEKRLVPVVDARIELTRACKLLVGHVRGAGGSTRVKLERLSRATGDTFMATVGEAGNFEVCLPEGAYNASLIGPTRSIRVTVDLAGAAQVELTAFAADEVMRAPPRMASVPADLPGLVADIDASHARMIGIGEATHGTAEFVTARADLTLELIRRAGARLLLFELDAIASVALDNYVNGGDVDLAKAIPALGFWTTDTHEFRRFLEQLRTENATAADKVHIWGIDLQNTTLPVNVLVENAEELAITPADQVVLKRMVKRGKAVLDLSRDERAKLDALLARIAAIPGTDQHHLLEAVAARSLAVQLDYWIGDMPTWYRKRRDRGMAEMASFLAGQRNAGRAIVWAHDAHITKEPGERMLGYHLSRTDGGYYGVGCYLHQGSARAWDERGRIGVISHAVPVAPPYALEHVVLAAAGLPSVAWVPLRRAPALASWLAMPRYVREIYATYAGQDASLILRDERAGFDAIVIIQTGHDSTPTPTGVRTADHG